MNKILLKKARHAFLCVLCFLCSSASANSIQNTYFESHPENGSLEDNNVRIFSYIIQTSLHRLARHYQNSQIPIEKEMLVNFLAGDLSFQNALSTSGIFVNSPESVRSNLLGPWRTQMPKNHFSEAVLNAIPGDREFELGKAAFDILQTTRRYFGASNFEQPHDALTLIGRNPKRIDSSKSKTAFLDRATAHAKEFCHGDTSLIEKTASVAKEYSKVAKIYSTSKTLQQLGSTFFLNGKSCDELVYDLVRIASPDTNPLTDSPIDSTEEVEGLTKFLASLLFESGSHTPFAEKFLSIEKIDHLDTDQDLFTAVKWALSLSDSDTFRTIAFITHNHGIELYMPYLALSFDGPQAIQNALRFGRALNNLYRITTEHAAARKRLGPTKWSEVEKNYLTVERPYHFWAGALVARELFEKQYPIEICRLLSTAVGSAYEAMTSQMGGSADTNVDVELHSRGATFATTF